MCTDFTSREIILPLYRRSNCSIVSLFNRQVEFLTGGCHVIAQITTNQQSSKNKITRERVKDIQELAIYSHVVNSKNSLIESLS